MMQIGFIGAGKVGYSLGKYFTVHGSSYVKITGYCSKHKASAVDAAKFTNSKPYDSIESLAADCDILFLTVPDTAIETTAEQMQHLNLQGKIICHCSGALSSAVFSKLSQNQVFCYSIHPFFAVSDRYESYKELSKALFTIEGTTEKLFEMQELLEHCGLKVQTICTEKKASYHAAAAIASNLMAGLIELAAEQMMSSGFSRENALLALKPLMQENLASMLKKDTAEALTGPLERGDTGTVKMHLNALEGEDEELYRLLSKKILKVAKKKNPERDYHSMEHLLEK